MKGPRASVKPVCLLALSKAQACIALGITPRRLNDALDQGAVVARQLGKNIRVPIFGPHGLQAWFETWPIAKRKVR